MNELRYSSTHRVGVLRCENHSTTLLGFTGQNKQLARFFFVALVEYRTAKIEVPKGEKKEKKNTARDHDASCETVGIEVPTTDLV